MLVCRLVPIIIISFLATGCEKEKLPATPHFLALVAEQQASPPAFGLKILQLQMELAALNKDNRVDIEIKRKALEEELSMMLRVVGAEEFE